MVDIVGMEIGDRGHNCHAHEVCGEQLVPRSKVHFHKETMISLLNGKEEGILTAYIVGNVKMTCMVSFLPHHLALHQADDYNGVYA